MLVPGNKKPSLTPRSHLSYDKKIAAEKDAAKQKTLIDNVKKEYAKFQGYMKGDPPLSKGLENAYTLATKEIAALNKEGQKLGDKAAIAHAATLGKTGIMLVQGHTQGQGAFKGFAADWAKFKAYKYLP